MTVNVGTADRLIRIILGLFGIVLPFLSSSGLWTNPLAQLGIPIVGAVIVVTALVPFCPLYRLIGMRTCKV